MNKKLAVSIIGVISLISAVGYTGLAVEIDFIVLPSGERINNIVLSSDNYTKLQNNVGIMAVIDIQKNQKVVNIPTTNYCPLALKIWQGHVGYYDKIAIDHEDRMIPRYCYHEYFSGYIGQYGWFKQVVVWFEENKITSKEMENAFEYLRNL